MVAFFSPGMTAKRAAATISLTASPTSNSSSSTRTFSGTSIGTANATRKVIAAIFCGGTARTLSTFTIAGNPFTRILETSFFCLGIADVPTGTTADIVVTWSGTKASWGLAVYRTTNVRDSAPASGSTVSFSGLTASTSIVVPGGGVVIGHMHGGGTGSRTITWSGVTEGFDAYIRTVATDGYAEMHSGGSLAYAEGQAAQTISATLSGDLADSKEAYVYAFR
jgi:hypothetical protein